MHAAYKKLRQLYAQGSLALLPVEEDMSADERDEIIIRLDEAYKRLTGYLGGQGKSPAHLGDEDLSDIGVEVLDGHGLKKVRNHLGVGLGEIELKTRIASRYLEALEEHRFDVLPEDVFVQGYVGAYAKSLGLDRVRAVRDFMSALKAARE